ncbi:hypothetical protein NQ318_009696, partial [Aromia moschata]
KKTFQITDTYIFFLGRHVLSNLPLQMALYFNVIFAPVWTVFIVLFLIENYSSYNELYKFIIVTIIATLFVVEALRLYLGYEGNLRDRIPELAGFWMLTLFLQFPLQGISAIEPILWILISGYCALKYTATQQTIYFRNIKLGTGVKLADTENKDD